MESYLKKQICQENPGHKKDEYVKSNSESESDSGCTPTAAELLCTHNKAQETQHSKEGNLSTSELINSCSHPIKNTENTTETLAIIPQVLDLKDVAYLKYSNDLPLISEQL